jgi:hypothetical protein
LLSRQVAEIVLATVSDAERMANGAVMTGLLLAEKVIAMAVLLREGKAIATAVLHRDVREKAAAVEKAAAASGRRRTPS